jgi:hypothetical protein
MLNNGDSVYNMICSSWAIHGHAAYVPSDQKEPRFDVIARFSAPRISSASTDGCLSTMPLAGFQGI